MLIRPAENWLEAAWDPSAEALHGLARRKLERAGLAPEAVCEAMNHALAGAMVYSDAPDWDGFWLYRLYEAARARQTFKLSHFADLFEKIPAERFQEARIRAEKKAPHRHRARADVLHMRALYRFAIAEGGA